MLVIYDKPITDNTHLIIFFLIDAYEAEQLLKEVDIHSVTGNLKSYLRVSWL